MDRILIKGGSPLYGTVEISGSKNAALPIMAACILTAKPLVLHNMPHLADVSTMITLLSQHGISVEMESNCAEGCTGRVFKLCGERITSYTAPYEIVRKMRASVLVLGPLLARFGEAKVSLPGGCAIGTRPIDMHLKALEALGAHIELDSGYIIAHAKNGLKGANIHFEKTSVGATENILMAATLANGTSVIRGAAREPEVTDLANLLVKMGAKIEGIGSDTLTIEGVSELHGATHSIIPDRIEAGSFAVAAAITGGEIELHRVDPAALTTVLEKLSASGSIINTGSDHITVKAGDKIRSTDISTQPFPEFPTDMQAQFVALLSLGDSVSLISENIFENRFMHVSELLRMGANITINGHTAVVRGVDHLIGAEVMATDLRASVSLVLAGLAARGETIINRIYHLDRGYERMEEKMLKLGANIERIK